MTDKSTTDTPAKTHRRTHLRMTRMALLLALLSLSGWPARSQGPAANWRSATETELQALLPARAPVEKEHIETEMRSASGITNGHGRFFAGVVLITAGYSADGKYSHYLTTQLPIQIGDVSLPAGDYVFGWKRGEEVLNVSFFDAATGAPRGSVVAARIANSSRVESFKIWPPRTKSLIQIGRFGMPYRISK